MVRPTLPCGISPARTSVARLVGDFRARLPIYASTYHAQDSGGGLDAPEAFAADYALACRQRGFAGFKFQGRHNGDARREAAKVLVSAAPSAAGRR